jgi:hypothetical protein
MPIQPPIWVGDIQCIGPIGSTECRLFRLVSPTRSLLHCDTFMITQDILVYQVNAYMFVKA